MDKIVPPGTPVLTGYWAKEYARLQAERDMLRAETDHLKRLLIAITDERDDLRAQITTLEWQLSEATKAAERLQAALEWYASPSGGGVGGDGGQRARDVLVRHKGP